MSSYELYVEALNYELVGSSNSFIVEAEPQNVWVTTDDVGLNIEHGITLVFK
jgi:hypothetical protein